MTNSPIRIKNTWETSIDNNVNTLSFQIENCTIGNTLIMAFACRSANNNITISSDWVLLGGKNVISTPDETYQYIQFAYKKIENTTENITITQTSKTRIYVNIIEFIGIKEIIYRSDLASRGETSYTVTVEKSNANDIMLYAVSSAYYSSGRLQFVNPNDLIKIEGNQTAERLASWFDDGTGALSHSFSTFSSSENRDAICECIQLIPNNYKYLIRSQNALYTYLDNELIQLEDTIISAELFANNGFETKITDTQLLKDLINPEILYWTDNYDILFPISVSVTGIPPIPQTIITNTQDMSDSTILGIEGIQAVCSDDILFALSFDDETTWKAYNGTSWITLDLPNTGMTKTTMESIGLEAWAEVVTSNYYKVRFILPTTTSYMTSMVVNYIN